MKKTFLLAGVVALMSISQVYAQDVQPVKDNVPPCPMAQRGGGDFQNFGGRHHFMKPHIDFDKELKLTDEQKAKVKQFKDEEREALKPLFSKLETLRAKEFDVMKKEGSFEEKQPELDSIRQAKMEIGAEIHKIKKANRDNFKSVLTKKQLKKLEKIKEQHRKDFKKNAKKCDCCRRMPMPPMNGEFGRPQPPMDGGPKPPIAE